MNKNRNYGTSKQLIQECEDILLNAIKIRCRADVPIAITLSGGVDSTLIYTLIKEKFGFSIQPFVFKHPNKKTDESNLAINLARKYGDDPIVVEDPASPLESLKKILWHLELPFSHPSAVSFFSTYKEISKRGYKVVLEGHGSDEQLGGYPYMLQASAIEALQNAKFTDYFVRKKVLFETHHPGFKKITNLEVIRSCLSDLKQIVYGGRVDLNEILQIEFIFSLAILFILLYKFNRDIIFRYVIQLSFVIFLADIYDHSTMNIVTKLFLSLINISLIIFYLERRMGTSIKEFSALDILIFILFIGGILLYIINFSNLLWILSLVVSIWFSISFIYRRLILFN